MTLMIRYQIAGSSIPTTGCLDLNPIPATGSPPGGSFTNGTWAGFGGTTAILNYATNLTTHTWSVSGNDIVLYVADPKAPDVTTRVAILKSINFDDLLKISVDHPDVAYLAAHGAGPLGVPDVANPLLAYDHWKFESVNAP